MRDFSIKRFFRRENPSATDVSEVDFAYYVIRLVSSFGWGGITVLQIFEIFLSNNKFEIWQPAFAIVAVALWLWGLRRTFQKLDTTAFLPLAFFFIAVILSPLPGVTETWTSIGLITITIAVYITNIESKLIRFAVLVLALVAQTLGAEFNFHSVDDTSDLSYGHTYYSNLWLLLVFGFLLNLYNNYLKVSYEIDEQIDGLENLIETQSQRVKLLNMRDSMNLRLHGTVLNTLLFIKKSYIQKSDYLPGIEALQNDVRNFPVKPSGNFQEKISQEFGVNNPYRVKIDLLEIHNLELNENIQDQIVEVVREIILNLSKHTKASRASIAITQSNAHTLITVNEDSVLLSPINSIEKLITDAGQSRSLRRLLQTLDAVQRINYLPTTREISHQISVDTRPLDVNPEDEIGVLRGKSVSLIADRFALLAIIYGAAIIPPLIIARGVRLPIVIFALSIGFALLSWYLKNNTSKFYSALFASLLGLAVIPIFLVGSYRCENMIELPWIFNGLLGSILLISASASSRILRWGPLFAFVAEAVSTRIVLPNQCSDILQGSTPGLILILIFAYLIGRRRALNIQSDTTFLRSIRARNDRFQLTLSELELVREELLLELNQLAEILLDDPAMSAERLELVDLEIQKLRVFLICSEFFEFEFIRAAYSLVRTRLLASRPTKIHIYSIYGFEPLDSRIRLYVDQLSKVLPELALEFMIDSDPAPQMTILASASDVELVRGLVNQLISPIPINVGSIEGNSPQPIAIE
jgi:signal transduction histidine kinase